MEYKMVSGTTIKTREIGFSSWVLIYFAKN
jgi:hypothetical protein